MRLLTMSFPIPENVLKNTVALASDIDDTLTIDGRILGDNLAYLSKLRKAGIKVLLVTGRTAGHGLTATTYFDIDGAIAENGGVICQGENQKIVDYFSPETMEKIKHVFHLLAREFPKARPTSDNFMRLTDQTFYIDDFSQDDIEKAKELAAQYDLGIIYSSVHLHIYDPKVNKGRTLSAYLKNFGIQDMSRVITIGDSPNDEGIFDTDLFPNSVGVKNVEDYLDRLEKKPRYILSETEGHGFARLAENLLLARK